MESLKRSIRYQFMESKKFILSFWSTVLIVNIFFYLLNNMKSIYFGIGFSMGFTEGSAPISIAGINLMIVLISLLVYSYERNYESFPLAISLSMSRKDYFLSFLIDNIFISFVFAMIQGVLLKIDPFFIKLVDRIPLYEFLYFNTKTDNLFFIIFTLFISFLGFISLWGLISSLNYKFGYKMWIVLIGFNILFSIFNIDFITKILDNLGEMLGFRFGIFSILFFITSIVVLYIINYFVVIKTNIKKNVS